MGNLIFPPFKAPFATHRCSHRSGQKCNFTSKLEKVDSTESFRLRGVPLKGRKER